MALTTKDWNNINEAIKTIYHVADERETRKNIMDAIFSIIYFDFGDFCYAAYDGLVSSITDPVVKSRFSRAFQQEYEYTYQNCFSQLDYTKWCLGSNESIAFRESDIIDNSVRLRSKFFTDFLQPRNLIYSMGCYIINSTNSLPPGAIALYRDGSQEDFSEHDLEMLNVLLPHIEKSLSFCFIGDQPEDTLTSQDFYLMSTFDLTKRELNVINELKKGLSNKEIAQSLNISIHTVKKHVSNILSKTNTESRIKLMQLISNH